MDACLDPRLSCFLVPARESSEVINDPKTTERTLARYDRQVRFAPLGREGQERLAQARVFLCGCGALGTVLADILVRAGVGFLRIADRDFVEWNNLQRQVLFDEQDAQQGVAKAPAAAEKLQRINSQVQLEPVVTDVNWRNLPQLASDVDLILDGTDNFETRFLLNDFALKHRVPWIYGGVIGAEGQTLVVLPGEGPCLRCLLPEPPAAGTTPTCDTAGVLAPAVHLIASLQALEALKILSGHREAVSRFWTVVSLWDNVIRQVRLSWPDQGRDCPACSGREFPWLEGRRGTRSEVLCGRDAVQLLPPQDQPFSLQELGKRLQGLGPLIVSPHLVRLQVPGYEITVFADGRAIVKGTDDPQVARAIYAKYIGN